MNGASPVLSLNDRTRPRWLTVVPTTDRHWVRSNSPNTPLTNFLQVSTNGHIRGTVVPMKVHPAQPFWLLETLFLRVSHFFKVSSNGHMWQIVIPTTARPAQPFWLSETLFQRVSLYFSKCPQTDNYDGPSYPRLYVLHDRYDGQRPLSYGSPYFFQVSYDGLSYLWRSVLHIPSYKSETLLRVLHIYIV